MFFFIRFNSFIKLFPVFYHERVFNSVTCFSSSVDTVIFVHLFCWYDHVFFVHLFCWYGVLHELIFKCWVNPTFLGYISHGCDISSFNMLLDSLCKIYWGFLLLYSREIVICSFLDISLVWFQCNAALMEHFTGVFPPHLFFFFFFGKSAYILIFL